MLFANVPTQAESPLHCLEPAAGGISLKMNAKFMCFKQEGAISIFFKWQASQISKQVLIPQQQYLI